MADQSAVGVALQGVPETALLTFWTHVLEAGRADTLLPDPVALQAAARVNHSFQERFGTPDEGPVVRALAFDAEVRAWLADPTHRTVVSLGEGLETELWRVDDGRVRWITVDLPEMIEVRRRMLPDHSRNELVAASALDLQWLDLVAGGGPVLVLAQGLLMYFSEAQVLGLLAGCAARLPGGALVFDTIPRWAATTRGHRQGRGYRLPPTPWGIDDADLEGLAAAVPGVSGVTAREMPAGRGVLLGRVFSALHRMPWIGRRLPLVVRVSFERSSGTARSW